MLYIYWFLKWTCFHTIWWYLLFYDSIACMNTIIQLIISCIISCVVVLKLPPGGVTGLAWAADKTMCLFNVAHVVVKGLLVSTMSLASCPFLWFSCILPAIAYGSSLDNNPTYYGYTLLANLWNAHTDYV